MGNHTIVTNSFPKSHSLLNTSFTISHKQLDGPILTAYIRQLSNNSYEVFVKEKEVIIQCKKDQNGMITCELSKRRIPWVEGISNEITKALLEQ